MERSYNQIPVFQTPFTENPLPICKTALKHDKPGDSNADQLTSITDSHSKLASLRRFLYYLSSKEFKYWIYSFPHISRVANTFLNFSPISLNWYSTFGGIC